MLMHLKCFTHEGERGGEKEGGKEGGREGGRERERERRDITLTALMPKACGRVLQ